MSLDHVILGLLSEHPRTGYDLKTRCFDDALKPLWSADQAQIYRTLDRLRGDKLVSSRRRRQSGRPDRHLYEITQRGRESLDEWLAAPMSPPTLRDPLLLQLYFGSSAGDEPLLDLLRARRSVHQERLEDLRAHASRVSADRALSDRASTLRLTAFDGAIVRERALIDWLDDCIDAIDGGTLPGSQAKGIGQRHLFGS